MVKEGSQQVREETMGTERQMGEEDSTLVEVWQGVKGEEEQREETKLGREEIMGTEKQRGVGRRPPDSPHGHGSQPPMVTAAGPPLRAKFHRY